MNYNQSARFQDLGHYGPVVLLALLYDWHFCGCRRYRDDDCTELWQMTTVTVVGLTFRPYQLFLPYNRNIRP